MLEDFGTLGLFVAAAIIFPTVLILLPLLLRYSGVIPQHPSSVKQDTYECGMKPFRDAWTQFNFHYYTYAILFVVLDVMSVFIFPWAVTLDDLGEIGELRGDTKLFSEANTRWLVEVEPAKASMFEALFGGIELHQIGETGGSKLTIIDNEAQLLEADIAELENAWKNTIWHSMGGDE